MTHNGKRDFLYVKMIKSTSCKHDDPEIKIRVKDIFNNNHDLKKYRYNLGLIIYSNRILGEKQFKLK